MDAYCRSARPEHLLRLRPWARRHRAGRQCVPPRGLKRGLPERDAGCGRHEEALQAVLLSWRHSQPCGDISNWLSRRVLPRSDHSARESVCCALRKRASLISLSKRRHACQDERHGHGTSDGANKPLVHGAKSHVSGLTLPTKCRSRPPLRMHAAGHCAEEAARSTGLARLGFF
jgi:hypothetical protein